MKRYIKILISLVTALLVLVAGEFVYSYTQLNAVPKFSKSKSLKFNITNLPHLPNQDAFLLFTVGSQGLTATQGKALGIGAGRASMSDGLTDSMMLILTNKVTHKVGILSINRDLYMSSTGNRINAAYNMGGVNELINEVYQITGVMVDHEVKANFQAFADLTNIAGGVNILIPNAVVDQNAMLNISNPGCIHMDGATALAFARARHWLIQNASGQWVNDATSSDFGRIERQQSILRVLSKELLSPNLVTQIPSLLTALKNNMTFDAGLNTNTILSLASTWGSNPPKIYASTTTGQGMYVRGMDVVNPNQNQIYQTIYNLANKIGYNLGENWAGNKYIIPVNSTSIDNNTSVRNSTTLSSDELTSSENNFNWSPDTGTGAGGLLFHSCENGNQPIPFDKSQGGYHPYGNYSEKKVSQNKSSIISNSLANPSNSNANDTSIGNTQTPNPSKSSTALNANPNNSSTITNSTINPNQAPFVAGRATHP